MSDDLPTYEQVFESFNNVYKVIDMMDASYRMYDNNFLMKYYQNRGVKLRDIYIHDMLNWLCFLGWGDGHIDVNEVMFINELLKLNLTQLDVLDIVKTIKPNDLTILPVTFAIFMEYKEVSGTDADIVEALYTSFLIAGTYFIACDGDIDKNEVVGLELYLENLRLNIQTFNINSLHDYMLENI